MVIQRGEQLLIIDIPQRAACLVLAKEPQMGQQLPKPHIVRHVNDFSQYGQGLTLSIRNHGTKSPILGSLA